MGTGRKHRNGLHQQTQETKSAYLDAFRTKPPHWMQLHTPLPPQSTHTLALFYDMLVEINTEIQALSIKILV